MNDGERKSPAPVIRPPGLLDTVLSVLASFFGVQSEKNRQRDFTAGKPVVFIGVAITLTVLLVVGLIVVVRVMLSNAGM